MKIYCNFGTNKNNIKKLKYYVFFKKTLFLLSVIMNMKKIFEEEESIEILKILCLFTNLEEYQKRNDHVWKKHKPRI